MDEHGVAVGGGVSVVVWHYEAGVDGEGVPLPAGDGWEAKEHLLVRLDRDVLRGGAHTSWKTKIMSWAQGQAREHLLRANCGSSIANPPLSET